ncbi:hypothetical protein VTO73DRAFT_11512 [Trametes versicolor]
MPAKPATYILSGPVPTDEWARFCHYSAFVSRLRWSNAKNPPEIAPPTWIYLERLSRGRPLLPSLRHLRWTWASAWSTELLLLATPALEHLTIDYNYKAVTDVSEWEDAVNALFRHVFAVSTRITHLILHTGNLDFLRHVPLLTTLGQLRQLKLQQFYGMADGHGANELHILSRLPELDFLSLAVDMYADPLPAFHGFKRLRKLIVTDTGGVQKLFATCNPSSLRDLDLTHGGGDCTVDEWIATSEAVSANLPRLVKFDWRISPDDADELSTSADTLSRMLKPLASLRLLQYVTITIDVACADHGVPDTLLRMLAEAWPRLRTFNLLWMADEVENNHAYPPIVTPSTNALAAFATCCPKLDRLSLTSLFVPEASLEDVIAYPLSSHPLRLLSAKRFRSTNTQMAALVLDRLFPRIDIEGSREKEDAGGPGIAEHPSRWAEVMGTLKLCRLARITRPDTVGL